MSVFALDPDVASMDFDDPFHQIEPDPRPFSGYELRVLNAEEFREELGKLVGGDAHSLV